MNNTDSRNKFEAWIRKDKTSVTLPFWHKERLSKLIKESHFSRIIRHLLLALQVAGLSLLFSGLKAYAQAPQQSIEIVQPPAGAHRYFLDYSFPPIKPDCNEPFSWWQPGSVADFRFQVEIDREYDPESVRVWADNPETLEDLRAAGALWAINLDSPSPEICVGLRDVDPAAWRQHVFLWLDSTDSSTPECVLHSADNSSGRTLILIRGYDTESVGFQDSRDFWLPIMNELTGLYQSIVYFSYNRDRPDEYDSSQTKDASLWGNHVPLLRDLIQNCASKPGVDSIDIIGHSLGGVIANEYATRHRDEIAAAGVVKNIIALHSPLNGMNWLRPLPSFTLDRLGKDLRSMSLMYGSVKERNLQTAKYLGRAGIAVNSFLNLDDGFVVYSDSIIDGHTLASSLGRTMPDLSLRNRGWSEVMEMIGNIDRSAGIGHNQLIVSSSPEARQQRQTLRTILSQDYEPLDSGSPEPEKRIETTGHDKSVFLTDVTVPDGSNVTSNQAITKTWRVRNAGASTWQNYRLKFDGGDRMSGPDYVDIPPTGPGQTVDITVNLRGPQTSGRGYWQIVNADGVHVSGGRLYIDVRVADSRDGGGPSSPRIATFTPDPGSPSEAITVNFVARVNWWDGYRAMRVLVDNEVIGETSTTEHTFSWDAGQVARGDHTVVLEVDDQTGPSWDNPDRAVLTYTLIGTPQPANHAPHRPQNTEPYDWYVYYSGNTARLCAQENGDPDGDGISAYYFDIFDSAQLWNSGWVGSHCVTTGALAPHTFQWRVKVRDSKGGESAWSDPWHFSVVDQNVNITQLYFEPQDGQSEFVKIRGCTEGHGGVNIAMRASVNDANDGSDSGEWHIIKELGVPCFNDIDAPEWRTLTFSDGPHRVRLEAFSNAEHWDGYSVREEIYTLPHRRPSEPYLISPLPPGDGNETVFLNDRTVAFRWQPSIRAQGYRLLVSTTPSPKDNANVLNQTIGAGTTEHTVTFDQDYPLLYWQIQTWNDVGPIESVIRKIGIDRVTPSCTVQTGPATVWESVFQTSWSAADALAGTHSYDIQVMDQAYGEWTDWLNDVPVDKTFDLYTGQPGHTYAFRCRARDVAGNVGDYPDNPDRSVVVDVTARPQTPWWNQSYASKRNIVIQNNMSNRTLQAGYPVRLRFDGGTTPTAAQLYAASEASSKCDDIRIVHNDASELDRMVRQCSSSAIEIWTRIPMNVGASQVNNTTLQIYYGNPSPGLPPQNRSNVYQPPIDGNTVAMWYTDAGSGTTLADRAGSAQNCTIYSGTIWTNQSKFPSALRFPGGSNGSTVSCGTSSAFNLQAFTYEMYLRRTDFGNASGRIAGHLGNNQNRWLMTWEGDGRIKMSIWPCTTCGAEEFRSNRRISDHNWHHVAFSIQNRTIRIYVDGQLDYTGTIQHGNIRSGTPPFTIGSAENIFRAYAEVANIRYSNVARTSFPHGAFAAITTEPSTTVGDSITPPEWGEPDLAVLGTLAYMDEDGGVLIETTVQNQGDLDTKNGFFTDVEYGADGTVGAANVAQPVERWIASPIDAGKLITLTTVISNPFLTSDSDLSHQLTGAIQGAATSEIQEVIETVYIKTDSANSVSEPDEENNTGVPVAVCFAAPDGFETDDMTTAVTVLPLDTVQPRNVHRPEDVDIISFTAEAGQTYAIETSNLGFRADTLLDLYATEGEILATNDDYGDSLASRIEWTAPAAGVYYVAVRHWNPNVGGCGTQYDLTLTVVAPDTTLTGTTLLEGRDRHDVTLSVKFYTVGAATPTYEFTPTVTEGGEFTIGGMAPGTYEVAVKYSNTLQAMETVTLVEGANNFDFGVLPAGDADDNNLVALSDFGVLVETFNLQAGDANYDARADFDGDGLVTLDDFGLLVGNFNMAGENPSSLP